MLSLMSRCAPSSLLVGGRRLAGPRRPGRWCLPSLGVRVPLHFPLVLDALRPPAEELTLCGLTCPGPAGCLSPPGPNVLGGASEVVACRLTLVTEYCSA